MNGRGDMLCFFAVPEEATPLRRAARGRLGLRIVVTGMGPHRARAGVGRAWESGCPALVLTCGFAGGLNPALRRGTVICAVDADFPLDGALRAAGAVPGRFHGADRVLVTAAEKGALWRQTGADVVEMESEIIRSVCRERRVPSATVRVISDAADEDLPLDFNRLMTPDFELSYRRLARELVRKPAKVMALLRFRRGLRQASERLTSVLLAALAAPG